MNIRKTDNKLAKYWARIPVYGVREGVKVVLAHQYFNFEDGKFVVPSLSEREANIYVCISFSKL